MIFINLKTYQIGTGEQAKIFCLEAEKLMHSLQVPLTILAQAVDIRLLTQNTALPIWAQHVDDVEYGKFTGSTMPFGIMQAGASGTMINHTEHKIIPKDIKSIINHYQSNNFGILLSSRTPEEVIKFDEERPTYLSYEPSLYVGMKSNILDISPGLVVTLVNKIKSPLIIGAGIHKPEDIVKGFDVGAKGFLISSSILMDTDPIGKLREFMVAYRTKIGN